MKKPTNIIWGAATAAYQIEGAYDEDGRGLSVWDTFTQTEGAVFDGHTGNVACDHYHRFKEDIELMKKIGIRHYRFSISWPRILPNGIGSVNEKGLAFYDTLIDALLEAGIEPWVTLFHWDYPDALYRRGGWLNNESPDWFASYAKIVVDRYSDRVSNWLVFNEPQCFASAHVRYWEHAPSVNYSKDQQITLIRNVLLSYGKTAKYIRSAAKKTPKIGMVPTSCAFYPVTSKSQDVEAARILTYEKKNTAQPLFTAALWSDPIFLGTCPEKLLADMGYPPPLNADDLALIHEIPDYYAVNHYHSEAVFMGDNGPVIQKKEPGYAHTHMDWPVVPESMYWMGKFNYERYGKPLIICENGLASMDWLCADGKVHDSMRIDFMGKYLQQLLRLCEEGIPVSGYFHWSLMDNFEWAYGYSKRFGLIFVDYATQQRIIKDSGLFYRKVIESNGAILEYPNEWFIKN